MKAISRSFRATNQTNPFGRSAIRGAESADRLWKKAAALRQFAEERELAKHREKAKRRLAANWWKKGR